ncbi:hypothetical protein EMCRGX_G028998 [Ephydatia muelleri]
MPESYELLSATLRPVLDDLEHLMAAKSINIDGTDYALEFFLGGDLMGLARQTRPMPAYGVSYKPAINMHKQAGIHQRSTEK